MGLKSLLRTLSELSITDSAMSLLGGVWSKVWQGQLFTDKWEEGWVPFPHTGVDRVRDRDKRTFPVGEMTDHNSQQKSYGRQKPQSRLHVRPLKRELSTLGVIVLFVIKMPPQRQLEGERA